MSAHLKMQIITSNASLQTISSKRPHAVGIGVPYSVPVLYAIIMWHAT